MGVLGICTAFWRDLMLWFLAGVVTLLVTTVREDVNLYGVCFFQILVCFSAWMSTAPKVAV
jgi:hypothetical protein